MHSKNYIMDIYIEKRGVNSMNDVTALYKEWCEKATDPAIREELKAIEGKDDEITDRFWQDLSFGTAGLRGVLGAGTNRMNIYTVRKATEGLCRYLNDDFKNPSCVIGYDSRINSSLFAKEAACVLAAGGVKVYLFKELIPTPIVAYSVRELKCSSGIIITASHNPSKYNGYKCYDERGYQMTDAAADKTLAYINKIDMFSDVGTVDFDTAVKEGKISYVPDEVTDKFYDLVKSRVINEDVIKNAGLSVIYTPLNGTGNKPVRRILDMIGIKDVTVVPTQENPDGNFPTCPFPNPEIREAFNEALKLAENKKADLLLATDPDCDRVGIAVLNKGEYTLLTGNDVGCLLVDYILSQKRAKGTLCEHPIIIKSIVTTDMATRIAESYGAEVVNTLTGFKYMGEYITMLEEKGEADRFEMAFEESYGYLTGPHTRDKDAVNGSMMICEMASYYKSIGKTLIDAMNDLYKRFGHWKNSLFNFYFEGADGMTKMVGIMDTLRNSAPDILGNQPVKTVDDYKLSVSLDKLSGKTTPITLPKSNVIIMTLDNGDKVVVRPAGTEPKIKVYIMANGACPKCAEKQTESYKKEILEMLGIGE
jgi:phosphoglucomutase